MDFFNCGACLIDSQGAAITHEGLSWSFLWRETRLDWGVYGGRGVSRNADVSNLMSSVEDFEIKIIKRLQLLFLKYLYKDFSVSNFGNSFEQNSRT